jgi:hypothetical protein
MADASESNSKYSYQRYYIVPLNCFYLISIPIKIEQCIKITPNNIFFFVVSLETGYYKNVPQHHSNVGDFSLKFLAN